MKLEIGLSDKQFEFQDSLQKFDVTGYGGAKGGGKSAGARLVGLLECLTTPGLITGLFRRSYPELQDNHIGPLFKQFPELRQFYNSAEKTVRIPSVESELRFRYCENMADVDRQAGREYHRLLIEEAGDWLYEMWMGLIRNTNRCPIPGIRPSTGLCFNWGGLGHGQLRRIFWNKELRDNEKDLTWNFILAKVEDNPKLMQNDPGYLRRLESEPNEALRRAHRHGDPDIVAGQYFTELNRAVHVVKPFKIPAHWKWFGSYDYGFNHPSVWHFWAADEDGNAYLVAEIYKAQMFIEHQAKAVFEMAKTLSIEPPIFSAGHDCWATKKAGDPTIAEDFIDRGIVLVRANIQRVLGWKHVREYLHHETHDGGRKGPRVFMFETCPHTINCLQRMVHDPNNAEDVKKVDSSNGDVESGDDGADCFRYGLMSRPPIANKIEKPTLDRYKKKLSPTIDWKLA